jgi:hypothetical protein
VRLSLDDAARVKAGLRGVGEIGQGSLERIRDGADNASRALSLIDVAVRGVQVAGVAAGVRALAQAGDALTQNLSRLQNATGSVERAGQASPIARISRSTVRRATAMPSRRNWRHNLRTP